MDETGHLSSATLRRRNRRLLISARQSGEILDCVFMRQLLMDVHTIINFNRKSFSIKKTGSSQLGEGKKTHGQDRPEEDLLTGARGSL